jgi:hypothetical protein
MGTGGSGDANGAAGVGITGPRGAPRGTGMGGPAIATGFPIEATADGPMAAVGTGADRVGRPANGCGMRTPAEGVPGD